MTTYSIALDDSGNGVITIITEEGNVETIDSSHPNFTRIAQAALQGEDIEPFLSIQVAIHRSFQDGRVSIINDVVHFDDTPVHDNLAGTILRYVREGRETHGLVRFMERLNNNPSQNSRQQLFNWTQSLDMTITDTGLLVGFKGVEHRHSGTADFPVDKYPYQSSHSGTATIDGITHEGQTPIGVGAVIEMPRSAVQDNEAIGCSTGLHVGSHSYASSFATVLLEVTFDPADVVSVPNDCSFQKLRVCKYTIAAVHDDDLGDDLSDWEPEPEWDEDEAWNTFAEHNVPVSFLDRIRNRFSR